MLKHYNTVLVPLTFDVKCLFSPDCKPGHLRSATLKSPATSFVNTQELLGHRSVRKEEKFARFTIRR
jgi:hypothetical protein